MILIILSVIGLLASAHFTFEYIEQGSPVAAAFFSFCMVMNGYCLVTNLLA